MTVTKRQSFEHIRIAVNVTESSDEFVSHGLPSKAKDNPDSLLEAQQGSQLLAAVLRRVHLQRTRRLAESSSIDPLLLA